MECRKISHFFYLGSSKENFISLGQDKVPKMTVSPSSTSCPRAVDFFFSYLLITLHHWLVSQATSQTDLENWVTAIHSACASLFAKKLGKEDTVRLLKNQTKSLFQKIDMDGKMKKMAELQLSIVSDPKNRKAIENQVLETIFLREHIYHYFLLWSLFVLSRPESNCLGHSWRSGCDLLPGFYSNPEQCRR